MIPGETKHKKKQDSSINDESPRGRKMVKRTSEGFASGLTKKQDSSNNEHLFFESRLSSNFIDAKPKESVVEVKDPGAKRSLLRLKTKNQQVSNHISEFYSKKQYDLPAREEFRPESTIGFQNSIPSLLDLNNRSSVYEAIPYSLRNNSNLSNFWKWLLYLAFVDNESDFF